MAEHLRCRALHAHALKHALHLQCRSVLYMYAKCGHLHQCQTLFSHLPHRHDPVLWNIVISGLSASRTCDSEALAWFRAMHCTGEAKPNPVTMAAALALCARTKDLNLGRSLHSHGLKSGLEAHNLVRNALVSMYAKCGLPCPHAYAAFATIPHKDVVSWNAMIAGFAVNGLVRAAFGLFRCMVRARGPVQPNHVTLASLLPLCASSDTKLVGRAIHCYVVHRPHLAHHLYVCNSLLTFYLRLPNMEQAAYLFQRIHSRDLVSWNAIISGYTSNGEWSKALGAFCSLVSKGGHPDSVTIISTLPACAHLRQLQVGKTIHAYVLRRPPLREDITVGNSIITYYANCNNVAAAFRAFSIMSATDLISWNSMLDAFAAHTACNAHFTNLLAQMFTRRIRPDSITLLIVIRFCVRISTIEKVKEAHGYAIRAGLLLGNTDPTIGNAILDAYAKCGDMKFAYNTFHTLSDQTNLITFNSMISGYVNCGSHDDACMLFKKMTQTDLTTWNLMIRVCAENSLPGQSLHLLHELQAQGMRPDAMTVMSLIHVCAQTASAHLLRQCHGYVVRACLHDVRLMGSLLDVYAKCGNLDAAHTIYRCNSHKDLVMSTAMIGGFAMHGRGEEALAIFSHMVETGLKPDHVIITAVLSACSHAGLVREGLRIFHSIEEVHQIKPTMEQYACVVDLLARSGQVDDAFSFVKSMPIAANANIWGTLLGACKTHHKVDLGRIAADKLFEMEAHNVGNYVVMANLYASEARWDGVAHVRRLMRTRDLKKPAGCSWIEIDRTRNAFIAGDCSHPGRNAIYTTLGVLDKQIKSQYS